MNAADAYPRPAPLAERIKLRGCRNCLFFANDQAECRHHQPFARVQPTAWCGEWRATFNPRIGWESAFAGCELKGAPSEPKS